jgi:hypothetical protein
MILSSSRATSRRVRMRINSKIKLRTAMVMAMVVTERKEMLSQATTRWREQPQQKEMGLKAGCSSAANKVRV